MENEKTSAMVNFNYGLVLRKQLVPLPRMVLSFVALSTLAVGLLALLAMSVKNSTDGNRFVLKTRSSECLSATGSGCSTKVLASSDHAAYPGNYEFVITKVPIDDAVRRQALLRADQLIWAPDILSYDFPLKADAKGQVGFRDHIESNQVCVVGLVFHPPTTEIAPRSELIGIALDSENGFGPKQYFPPFPIERGVLYNVSEQLHKNGANCNFMVNTATELRFAMAGAALLKPAV